jgi:hypothetical protein
MFALTAHDGPLTERDEVRTKKHLAPQTVFELRTFWLTARCLKPCGREYSPDLAGRIPFANYSKRSLHHHDENYAALVPSANPAHTPPVDAIAQVGEPEQAQELGFHFHSHPWIAHFL